MSIVVTATASACPSPVVLAMRGMTAASTCAVGGVSHSFHRMRLQIHAQVSILALKSCCSAAHDCFCHHNTLTSSSQGTTGS